MFINHEQLNIEKWRSAWEKLLLVADSVICFSNASKEIVKTAYKTLDNNKIAVIPHQITDISPIKFSPKNTHHFRIGVLGAINMQKGLPILTKMAELIAKSDNKGKIIIVGETSENVESDIITVTGKYQRENLHTLIEKHNIELFFIPSIWPETFSYTAEEIMKMGLPLAVFDIGAPAERVKHYEKGLIINKIDANHALSEIINWRKTLN